MAKKHITKPVNEYVWAIERGYTPKKIPPRPIVAPTLVEFREVFKNKVTAAMNDMKGTWK
jgi:hypothetical protein